MNPETPRGMGRLNLRLLRGAIQYGEEVEADEVHDALLLRERALAPELVAEHAGRGQLGREPAPRRRDALQDGFTGKEVAGFDGSGARLRGARVQQAICRSQRSHSCSAADEFP